MIEVFAAELGSEMQGYDPNAMNDMVNYAADTYTNAQPSASDFDGMVATLGSFGEQALMALSSAAIVLVVIFFIVFLIVVISRCFIFKKLGIAPWKAVIPILGKMELSKRLYGRSGWGILASVGIFIPVVNFVWILANLHLIFGIYSEDGFDVTAPDLWTVFYIAVPLLCCPITAFSSKFTSDGSSRDYDDEDDEDDDEDVEDSDEDDEDEDNDEEDVPVPVSVPVKKSRKRISEPEPDEEVEEQPVRKSSKSTSKGSKTDQLMGVTIYEDGQKVDFEDDDEKREFIGEVLASADYKIQLKRDNNGYIVKANFKYVGED